MKEAAKRRALEPASPAFVDEDLRYRQLTRRPQPAMRAVVFFLLDVSGSMTERDRQMAKTFFFWVALGLRREYRLLDIVFVAHATEAWEFGESEFFKVAGSGGTVSSTGFAKVHEIIEQRFSATPCNVYLFYASDGDNALDDRAHARRELERVMQRARYVGYVEIAPNALRGARTETLRLFDELTAGSRAIGRFSVTGVDDIATAVRHFFGIEAQAGAA